MSVPRKTLIALALALVVFVVYRVWSGGIVATESGGLGAVSFGLSEALIEAFILAVAIAAFLVGLILVATPAAFVTRAVLLVILVVLAVPAHAQTTTGARVKRTLIFLTGAASGLAAHESGHVVFSAAFGAHPGVRPLEDSAIPFFKIVHDPVTRRKEFVISSAGMWMQYADSEWMLTARPRLRDEHAPFLKGMLAFDLATSTVYSVAAFARTGPPERDTRGMAVSLGRTGAREPVIGLMVLAPAVLDGYRFLRPDSKWAPWASRSVKIASVVLTMAAGR